MPRSKTQYLKGETKMNNKLYNSPEITVIALEANDVITTSDILAGLETPPTEAGSGSWETL